MENKDSAEIEKEFLQNPTVMKHYSLLQEIGVFSYIDSLNKELRNYENLLSGALDIFNRISIDEIMDATVWQITDRCLPSFISFLWKPVQNREDVTIRSFKNYKPVDLNVHIKTISAFEPFFHQNPRPVNLNELLEAMGECEDTAPLEELEPDIIIPILGPMGLYGLIFVGRKILANGYSQSEHNFLQQLMSFVSQAIKNHLHYEHSLRDVKTGLFNHGFFITRLNEELARVKRDHHSCSVIVIDVDKFKDFNDNYGHLAGDRVLECLAGALKQGVRNVDIPSRFGGEEFTVLLPEAGRDIAWMVAERLRKSVEQMNVPWGTPLPQVTISLGIYNFDREDDVSVEDILTRADEALYLSKERGRNRSTIWGEGLLSRIAHTFGTKEES